MPKTIRQMIDFRVAPERLYRLYLSSREHAVACGGWGRSKIDARVGGRMAMAPHIRGRLLWLVPGRMIVQTWRTANWKKYDPDSVLVLTFRRHRKGSRLTIVHANVPDSHAKSITGGWHSHYWRPWKRYLEAKAG